MPNNILGLTVMAMALTVTTAAAAAEHGLRASYFNNLTGAGDPILKRVDPTIDFRWGAAAPAPGVPAENFMISWRGQVEPPATGSYTFVATADDGIRLWVGGKLLIDRWVSQDSTTLTASVDLIAGTRVDLEVEYFDNTGYAQAELRWIGPGIPLQIVPSERLWADGFSGNGQGTGLFGSYVLDTYLTRVPFLQRVDPRVDFEWGTGGPIPGKSDNFSVRWSGYIQPRYSEDYTIVVRTDDGVRLWLDNRLVVDAWTPHGVTDYSTTIPAMAGRKYLIRLEYFERTGNSTAKLLWRSANVPLRPIPAECLFPLTGVAVPEMSKSLTSPVCIEGLYTIDALPKVATQAGQVVAKRIGDGCFAADVTLAIPGGKTAISLGEGGNSIVREILWQSVDVTGKDKAVDSYTVRVRDQMALSATGATWARVLEGSGVVQEFTQAVPTDNPRAVPFDAPGEFVIVVGTGAQELGSISVTVIDIDISRPIPADVGKTQQLDIAVSPLSARSQIAFGTSDPARLIISDIATSATHRTISVMPLWVDYRPTLLAARLTNGGPIINLQEVREFELVTDAVAQLNVPANRQANATLIMRPFVPDVEISFRMFAHTSTFVGGARMFKLVSGATSSSLGEAGFSLVGPGPSGYFDFAIHIPVGEDQYCIEMRTSRSDAYYRFTP